jgi:hypothetical protein
MLVQDHLGYVHDVPDSRMGGVVFDGLGNPVGLFPALAAMLPAIGGLVSKAIPAISNILPGVGKLFGGGGGGGIPGLPSIPGLPNIGNLVGSLFGGRGGAAAAAPPGMPPIPGFPRLPFPNIGQMFRPRPFPAHHCAAPVGWITPAIPYTGALPRRMYMRCSVWPGPKGLVPAAAATAAAAQAQAAAQAATAAAAAAGGGGRRRGRFRRRR